MVEAYTRRHPTAELLHNKGMRQVLVTCSSGVPQLVEGEPQKHTPTDFALNSSFPSTPAAFANLMAAIRQASMEYLQRPDPGRSKPLPASDRSMLCERDARALTTAVDFLINRYKQLAVTPPTSGIFARVDTRSSPPIPYGSADALLRVLTIGPHTDLAEAELIALFVHELAHAWGHVSISRDAGPVFHLHQLVNVGAAVMRRGVGIFTQGLSGGGRLYLFNIFEEGAATAHELAYYKVSGWIEEKSARYFSLADVSNARIRRAILKAFYPEQCQESEDHLASSGSDRIERVCADLQRLRFPIIETVATPTNEPSEFKTGYPILVASLDMLAHEIYHDLRPDEASQKLRDELCRVQVGKSTLASLLKPMIRAFGSKAVKFLSRLSVASGGKSGWEDTVCLSIFAQAGALSEQHKKEVRELLVDEVLERPVPSIADILAKKFGLMMFSQEYPNEFFKSHLKQYPPPHVRLPACEAIKTLFKEGNVSRAIFFQNYFRIPSEELPLEYQSQALERALSMGADGESLVILSAKPVYDLVCLFASDQMPSESLTSLPKGFALGDNFKLLARTYIKRVLSVKPADEEAAGIRRLRDAGVPIDESAHSASRC